MNVRDILDEPDIAAQAQQLDDFYQGALALADSEDVSIDGFSMGRNSFRYAIGLDKTDFDVFDVFSRLLKKYVERCIDKYEVLRTLKLHRHTTHDLIFEFSPPVPQNIWNTFWNIIMKRELSDLGELKEQQEANNDTVTYKLLSSLLRRGKRVELDARAILSGRTVNIRGVVHAVNRKPPHVITYDFRLDRKPGERVQSNSFFIPNGLLDDNYELEELPDGTWRLTDAT
jgi:hypothetical protein